MENIPYARSKAQTGAEGVASATFSNPIPLGNCQYFAAVIAIKETILHSHYFHHKIIVSVL